MTVFAKVTIKKLNLQINLFNTICSVQLSLLSTWLISRIHFPTLSAHFRFPIILYLNVLLIYREKLQENKLQIVGISRKPLGLKLQTCVSFSSASLETRCQGSSALRQRQCCFRSTEFTNLFFFFFKSFFF